MIKKVSLVFLGQFFLLLTSLLMTKIVVNGWDKDIAASYFLVSSVIAILIAIFISPIIQRYVQVKSQNKVNELYFIEDMTLIFNIIILIGILILSIIGEYYFSVILFVLFGEYNKVLLFAKFNTSDVRLNYTLSNVIIFFSRFFVLCLLIFVFNIRNIYLLFSIWGGSLLINIFVFREWLTVKFKNTYNYKVELSKFFYYAVPLSISACLSLGREQIPRYVFLLFDKNIFITDYSSLIIIATLFPTSLQLLITTVLSPNIARAYGGSERVADKKLILIAIFSFFFISIIALFFHFFAGLLISFLLSNKFLFLDKYISFVVFSYAFVVFGNLITLKLFFLGKTKLLLLINVFTFLTALSLGFVLFYFYGFLGVVSSLIISNLIFFFLSFWVCYNDYFFKKN